MLTVSSARKRSWGRSKPIELPGPFRTAKEYSVFRSVGDLGKFEQSWNAFIRPGLPMQQFGWIKACAETFSADQDLQLLVYEQAGRPRAIAPFVRKCGGNGRMELLGAEELSEPMDLVWADQHSLERLTSYLAELKTPFILNRIPGESPSISAIKKAFSGKGIVLCQARQGYPYIPLNDSWTTPEQNLSQRRRYDLRRALRRAEKIGPVTIFISSPTPEELGPLLNTALEVEARSWKGRTGTALADDPVIGNFFQRYAAYASREGALRICILRIGNKPAAVQIAVESAGRFCLLKIGYDEQFSSCSPGHLLMRETIKYAAERGLDSYDFLGIVEPWTAMWTESERPCISLRAYPANRRGISQFGKDFALWTVEKLKSLVNGTNGNIHPKSNLE